jgi:hypothetical protein
MFITNYNMTKSCEALAKKIEKDCGLSCVVVEARNRGHSGETIKFIAEDINRKIYISFHTVSECLKGKHTLAIDKPGARSSFDNDMIYPK